MNQLEQMTYKGYTLEELFYVADLMKVHNVTPQAIKLHKEAFTLGVDLALNIFNKGIKEMVEVTKGELK